MIDNISGTIYGLADAITALISQYLQPGYLHYLTLLQALHATRLYLIVSNALNSNT